MKEFAKYAWMFFLASLALGIWVIPALIVGTAILLFIHWKWPNIGDKL